MGYGAKEMTRMRLKFVQAFIDSYGTARHYFRRPGFKRVPLPGLPGSPEFMEAYQAAMAGERLVGGIGAKRSVPGTVNAAVAAYYRSLSFTNLAPISRYQRRRILDNFRSEHGDKKIANLRREHIQVLIAAKAEKPGAAHNFLSAIRSLLDYAVKAGLRHDNPALGVDKPKQRLGGFYCWTEADIAAFEIRHPIGTKARLALGLLLYTAQRRSDVLALGRQHIRDGVILVRQQKTDAMLAIPIHPRLQEILDATPIDGLTFLTNGKGRPFDPNDFSHWFKKRCREANLPPKATAHGLRKAACRRLAEAGCSANVIAAISGHRSLRMVSFYTKAADQERMARQGINAISPDARSDQVTATEGHNSWEGGGRSAVGGEVQ